MFVIIGSRLVNQNILGKSRGLSGFEPKPADHFASQAPASRHKSAGWAQLIFGLALGSGQAQPSHGNTRERWASCLQVSITKYRSLYAVSESDMLADVSKYSNY